MISGRHIRHDWNTWVDGQNQSSVRTVCGKKSTPHMSGIPGVTKQDQIVVRDNKRYWGWCKACAIIVFPKTNSVMIDLDVAPQEIYDLYSRAALEIKPIYLSHISKRRQSALKEGNIGLVTYCDQTLMSLK